MMAHKSPAFQFYPAEFLADANVVAMKEAEEVGAYFLLMLFAWREGTLSDDMEFLADLARMPLDRFTKVWEKRIKRCFRKTESGEWVHPRLETERVKQQEFREKMSHFGKKGGRPQKGTKRVGKGSEKGRPSSSSSSSSLSTSNYTSSSARATLPKEFQPDYDQLLDRLPEKSRTAWSAEITSAPTGLHSNSITKPPTLAQVGQAIRDFNANSEHPNLAHFRAYLRRATAEPKGGSVRSAKRNGKVPQEYEYPNLTESAEDLNWQT